jgi:protein SCO1
MKTAVAASIIVMAFFFTSCGNTNHKKSDSNATEQVQTAIYQCPMKCEGEKMYAEKGTCPVCKMDLELVTNEDEHKHHNH